MLTGGKRLDQPGNYYLPTVLADIPKDSPASCGELFGPVASLFRAKNAEDAIRIANSSPFGLGASAWTSDPVEREKFINGLESGMVFINRMVASDPRLPFGGVKADPATGESFGDVPNSRSSMNDKNRFDRRGLRLSQNQHGRAADAGLTGSILDAFDLGEPSVVCRSDHRKSASHGAGGFMYKVVRTSRLYEQIVQQIEESITKGTLKAGDQLPSERELALKFGVSRTAVREAVKALHEKGLVEAYSGRGTFVTNGTSQAVRQSIDLLMRMDQPGGSGYLAEVRQILEPEIAALAATRIQEPQLALMREAFSVMNDALKDPDAYIEADLDFHLALAEAAENPLILSLIDSIVGVLREQRMGIFFEDGGPQRGQYHHARILAAIERRDAEASRAAMRDHLQQVREDSRPHQQRGAVPDSNF